MVESMQQQTSTMGNSGPRVAPDGVLIDHVAEFVFERPERIKTLFSRDEDGYIDAVLRLVQTIAVGGTIVGSERPGATECTDKLKGALYESGRLEYVDFFNEEERRERLDSANKELGLKWNTICGEFANDRAGVSIALLGHMRREFQYYWRGWDPQWKSEWYSPANEALSLPAAVKQRILHEILMLASQYRMKKDETGLGNWIERCVTTHYRIFFEYWLYLGKHTGAEYMPALTRSSLRCIRDSNTDVYQLVLPFVALAEVKNVKTRGDLIKRKNRFVFLTRKLWVIY